MSTTYRTVKKQRFVQQRAQQFGIIVALAIIVLLGYFMAFIFLNEFPTYVQLSGVALAAAVIGVAGYFLYRIIFLFRSYSGLLERQTSAQISKTEGKFKALIQNSLDLITIVDQRGKITYVSPSSDRVLGYQPDDLMNQSIFELVHGEDHPLMQNVLEQKSSNFFFSFRMQHRDGNWLNFEATGTNLLDNPLIQGYVINSRDITDRKKEEENRRQKELAALRHNMEREKAEEERNIIAEQKQQLEEAYRIIEHKNNEITDSIAYAFRIQTALLPDKEYIKQHLPNSFILWKPKDIVSGDFFWFTQDSRYTLITAADCTGHGVPGAFMTMIGNTLLNQIILTEGIRMPDIILNRLHKGVRDSLRQDQGESKDGMDIAFMTIDHQANKVYFAGANNPLIYIRDGQAHQEKADKQAIGGQQEEDERIFTRKEVDIQPGDMYYTFSDGYQDQFGGEKGRKYMAKRFKRLLAQVSEQDVDEQERYLDQEIQDWMGEKYEQVDDIIICGVKM